MRIGIDARFYGGEQSKGLGRYTEKLITQLSEIDSENEYVVFLQDESFRLWSIANKRFFPIRAPYRWYTLAEQIHMPMLIHRAHVDLMHFPHFNVPVAYHGPFVVTIHDLIIQHFPTERATTLGPMLYAFKHFAGKMVMRHAVHHAKIILTVSEYSKNDIMRYYHLEENNIHVTYEATDPVELIGTSKQQEHLLRQYGIAKPYFLYIGNAYPHKNLEVLLDVWHTIQRDRTTMPWNLVLVGRKDYFYERLAHTVWAKNLDRVIFFPGFVPDKDLPILYQNAVAYIFPSLYEGFGLPPLEAMSYGLPVISTRSSCLPEILGDSAIFVDSQDISGIIQAMTTIANDEQEREKYIRKGYAQVAKYSWRMMAEKTLAIYQKYGKISTEN